VPRLRQLRTEDCRSLGLVAPLVRGADGSGPSVDQRGGAGGAVLRGSGRWVVRHDAPEEPPGQRWGDRRQHGNLVCVEENCAVVEPRDTPGTPEPPVAQELFAPRRIERVAAYTLGPHTGDSANDARFAVDYQTGRKWVAKLVAGNSRELVLAEATAYLLSNELGVQVPLGAVCMTDGQEAWLSGWIPATIKWHPSHVTMVRNIRHLGALLAIDVLTFSGDRRSGNVLLAMEPDGYLRLWGIDWAEALIGYPSSLWNRRSERPGHDALIEGVPWDLVRGRATTVARRARSLSRSQLRSIVTESCEVAKLNCHDDMLRVLRHRCRNALPLVRRFLDEGQR